MDNYNVTTADTACYAGENRVSAMLDKTESALYVYTVLVSFQSVLHDWCNKDWYVLSCLWGWWC